ncbi:hypothetical protein ABZ215_25150 [Amycolatopsis sp. NPDC006131]|uniref:hypothetical protein n=1 Tax=Amycolatopsis sp. NPDC006131 TaxID=3156731 RepID=UPI00339E66F4
MTQFVRIIDGSNGGSAYVNVAAVTAFRVVEAFGNPGHYAIYANGIEETVASDDFTSIAAANEACEDLVGALGKVDLTE